MIEFIAICSGENSASSNLTFEAVSTRVSENFPSWYCCFSGPRIRVFVPQSVSRNKLNKLDGNAGIVLGLLFSKSDTSNYGRAPRALRLRPSEVSELARKGPAYLAQEFWGQYIAFFQDSSRDCGWVFRGPLSDVPCNYLDLANIRVLSSSAALLSDLRLIDLTVDKRALQLLIGTGQHLQCGVSAINEIDDLPRGASHSYSGDGHNVSQSWDPARVCSEPLDEDVVGLSEQLRHLLVSCVKAWGAQHDGVLLRLSGGLDSSVVAASLAEGEAVTNLSAINYFWDGEDIDERYYARLVAERLNVPLHEKRFGTDRSIAVISNVSRTLAPVIDVIDWQEQSNEVEFCGVSGATEIFTGGIGDALFQRDFSVSAATEYLTSYGPSLAYFKVALDLAIREGFSIWSVMSQNAKGLFKNRGIPWTLLSDVVDHDLVPANSRLVDEAVLSDLIDTARNRVFESFNAPSKIPAGKNILVLAQFVESSYHTHFRKDSEPRVFSPLLSQPLVEFCLRIPTHLNFQGGSDRMVVKRAFDGILPSEVVNRAGKGSPASWLCDMIYRDRQFVREFLMEGELVAQQVVDPDLLLAALPENISDVANFAGTLICLLHAEAWLRAWAGAPSAESLSVGSALHSSREY
ncbi:MAG: asparagine synthase-related protein [Pseudomonadota bacterium]